ncbi:hypothetical protein AB0K16_32715 [Nonomuraea jabiensis]|uniref:hypothetical protein n=1 Tax=Nonomuraea jabiensis TaxID=882448 RepID=UPI0034412469
MAAPVGHHPLGGQAGHHERHARASRPVRTRCTPCRASARAVAWPMPPLAFAEVWGGRYPAVTRAVVPASFIGPPGTG